MMKEVQVGKFTVRLYSSTTAKGGNGGLNMVLEEQL
jgi:hypothetical protein